MAFITGQPNKIYSEDVAYGAANSEALFNKIGSSQNFVLDEFMRYEFGVAGGTYSGLTVPYTFASSAERVTYNSEITQLEVFNLITGASGSTSFRLERQVNGVGGFTTIFSVNGDIDNSASDDLFFTAIGGATPAGVTKPVFSTLSLAANDRLRLVLVSVASNARNLSLLLKTRPV